MASSYNPKLRQIGGYLAAFLPAASIFISAHIHLLHPTPLALSFILTCFIARSFGRGPSYLTPVLSALCFNFVYVPPAFTWAFSTRAILQTGIILALGLIIVYVFQRQQAGERKLRLANSSLQDRSNALIQAQQGSNSAAWSFDSRNRITTWYEGGVELFGRSLEELTAMGSPLQLVLEEDRPAIAEAFAHTVKTGELYRVEFRVRWPNGDIRWLESLGTPQVDDPGLWRGVSLDITQRKAAELALVRSEKIAAASQLASSVSHEINNPLAAATNLIYLARQIAVDDRQIGFLEQAESELARIAYVASQSMRFHRQQSAPVQTDIAQVLGEALKIYQSRLAAQQIAVSLEAQPVPQLLCFQSELRQVFGNLIQNALEAMPKGGSLRLRVGPATDWRSRTRGVRITISNTGVGMSPETSRRLFEPFFTTKGGTNTGLGLWIVAGIVDRHRGHISAWSSVHPERSGTAFRVFLPLQP